MITVDLISTETSLQQLVDEINNASWDEDNDLPEYDLGSLQSYLENQGTVFLVCYEKIGQQKVLLGMASGRIEVKPYQRQQWLYVDEVDVCADQRQKGAGKALMLEMIKLARNSGCQELWLGTETDNVPAQALYQSLHPAEVEKFIGYTYEFDK